MAEAGDGDEKGDGGEDEEADEEGSGIACPGGAGGGIGVGDDFWKDPAEETVDDISEPSGEVFLEFGEPRLVVDFGEGFAGAPPGVFAALEDLIDGVIEFGGFDWGCGLGGGGGGGGEGGESGEEEEGDGGG